MSTDLANLDFSSAFEFVSVNGNGDGIGVGVGENDKTRHSGKEGPRGTESPGVLIWRIGISNGNEKKGGKGRVGVNEG